MKRSDRVAVLLERLPNLYPDAGCLLVNWSSPFMLLISTILSARTTDASVNSVTPELWRRFPTPEALARAESGQVEKLVHSLGFFRNKASSIIRAAEWVTAAGRIPEEMDELLEIPGVGRKTASVMLAEAFGKPAIIVDTHVGRLSGRLDLSRKFDPDAIEADLQALLPKENWSSFSHQLGFHGRRVCFARTPACGPCELTDVCPRRGIRAGRSCART
jgi:endonuclease III